MSSSTLTSSFRKSISVILLDESLFVMSINIEGPMERVNHYNRMI